MGGRTGRKVRVRRKLPKRKGLPRRFSLDDSPPGSVDMQAQADVLKVLKDLGVETHKLLSKLLGDQTRVAILQEQEAAVAETHDVRRKH